MSELPLDPLFPNLTKEDYVKNIKMMVEGHNEIIDFITEKGELYGSRIPHKKVGSRYKLKLHELEKKPLEDLIKIHTKLWNDI